MKLKDTSLQPVSSEHRHHCNVFDEDYAVSITVRICHYASSILVLTFCQWAIIELARHPEIQRKLREELRQLSNGDPTYDQLMSGLPYLDAVVREASRLHPTVEDVVRVV